MSLIEITYVINPQLFWYRRVENQPEKDRKLVQLEETIKAYADEWWATKESQEKYVPAVGDTVAARNRECSKWIRAKIEFIGAKCKRNLIVWALDYGRPYTVREQMIVPITQAVKLEPFHRIHCGGIDGCIPAQHVSDLS